MTAPRDPDVLIAAFLDEGQTDLPDRTFDAVRRDIHQTRQRVVIGPWRESDMSILTRVAIAAAAVLAVGLAWINVGPGQPGIGAQPTPAPTASPSPSASPMTVPQGVVELAPGRYRFTETPPGATVPYRIAVTVPRGWTSYDGFAVDKNYGTSSAAAGASFVVWEIKNRYVDPCTNHTLLDPAPGPGVDELVAALSGQPGIQAGPPTNVTVDGYGGKLVELAVTADLQSCGGDTGFWTWGDPADHRSAQGTNELDRIYVLDIDGVRHTFFARIPAITTAADRAELEAIIASVDIQP